MQHSAPHCTILQHSATHCNTPWEEQCAQKGNAVAKQCKTLQQSAPHLGKSNGTPKGNAVATIQQTTTHCNAPQYTATHLGKSDATHNENTVATLQNTATHCNSLQHSATHCNTPQ